MEIMLNTQHLPQLGGAKEEEEERGEARRGEARRGKARRGEAREGKKKEVRTLS